MLTGLFDNAAKLLLPVVGLGVLVIAGVDDATTRQLFTIGLLAALSLIVIVVFLVRSERFTLAFGRLVGKVISSLLVRFGKNPLDDLGPRRSACASGSAARCVTTGSLHLRRRWAST